MLSVNYDGKNAYIVPTKLVEFSKVGADRGYVLWGDDDFF